MNELVFPYFLWGGAGGGGCNERDALRGSAMS
jgi:hypothetical protein